MGLGSIIFQTGMVNSIVSDVFISKKNKRDFDIFFVIVLYFGVAIAG